MICLTHSYRIHNKKPWAVHISEYLYNQDDFKFRPRNDIISNVEMELFKHCASSLFAYGGDTAGRVLDLLKEPP